MLKHFIKKMKSKFRLAFPRFFIRAQWKKVTSRAKPSWKTFSSSYGSSQLSPDSSLVLSIIFCKSLELALTFFNRIRLKHGWSQKKTKYIISYYISTSSNLFHEFSITMNLRICQETDFVYFRYRLRVNSFSRKDS